MSRTLITISQSATREMNNILKTRAKCKGFYFGIKNMRLNEYDLIPMTELKKFTKDDKICKINDINIQICGNSLSGLIRQLLIKDKTSSKFTFDNPNKYDDDDKYISI